MVTTATGIATSFIQFSRASNATVTNNVGNIAWAGHNLLLNSEQFDSSNWSKTAGTTAITANQAVAPNGTTTADLFNEGTGAGYRLAEQAISTTLSVNYTVGFYAKYISCRWVSLSFYSNSSPTSYGAATFDLLNGVVGTSAATGTGYAIVGSPVMEAVGNGWYRCSLTVTNGSVLPANLLAVAASNVGTIGNYGLNSYTGTSQTFYVWGASMYRSDLGGMVQNPAQPAGLGTYYPTTPKNLLGFTNAFTTGWGSFNILAFGSGSVANAGISPNGLQNAQLLIESTATGARELYFPANVVANTPYTWSVYVKPAGRTIVRLRNFATALVYDVEFNLVGSGTSTNRSGTGNATVVALDNGWYRITATATATAGGVGYFQINMCESANSLTYTGTGTLGIYLWGAQLSDSASIDPYVPNYGAAPTAAAYYAPRLDYSPTTIQPLGMLVEEQRTNALTYSSEFDNAAWSSKAALNTTGTPAWVNVGVAPDGTTTADRIIPNTNSDFHYIGRTVTVTSGIAYTASFYAKNDGYGFIRLYDATSGSNTVFTLSGAGSTSSVTGTPSITPIGTNGWYRCTLTFTTSSTSCQPSLYPQSTASMVAFAGDGSSGVLLWGAQLEAGSFATSYIPTGASTVTRSADIASVSTQAFPYSASESTIVASASPIGPGGANGGSVLSLKGASGNGLLLYQSPTTYSLSAWVDASNVSLGTSSFGAIEKLAIAYNGVSNGAVRNGGAVSSVGATVAAAANSFYFGGNGATFVFNGHIRQITYLPRRISNTELQTRTA